MMMKFGLLALTVAGALAATLPTQHVMANPAGLTVVELFQSEGCSSCPPAEAILNRLAARPNILALSFEVTYWDQLGWKDRYAQPAFTARQWEYARAAGAGEVFTPQIIVNGQHSIIGANNGAVEAALAKGPGGVNAQVAVKGRAVAIAGRTPAPATVWLVTYDPRTINVAVHNGENAGRTLPHRNIVLGLQNIGTWAGGNAHLSLPTAPASASQAVLVQAGKGGPIVAAARVS